MLVLLFMLLSLFSVKCVMMMMMMMMMIDTNNDTTMYWCLCW